jgi:fatty acid synthase
MLIIKSSLLFIAVFVCVINKGCNVAGLGAKEAKQLCPPDIEVACHNGPNFCTLSGPANSMKKFVKTLQQQGVFAKEVNFANIAYHSKYIAPASLILLKYLREVSLCHVINYKPVI